MKEEEINEKFVEQILRRTSNTLKFLVDEEFNLFWNIRKENTTLFIQRNKFYQCIDECIVRKLNEICTHTFINSGIYSRYLLRSADIFQTWLDFLSSFTFSIIPSCIPKLCWNKSSLDTIAFEVPSNLTTQNINEEKLRKAFLELLRHSYLLQRFNKDLILVDKRGKIFIFDVCMLYKLNETETKNICRLIVKTKTNSNTSLIKKFDFLNSIPTHQCHEMLNIIRSIHTGMLQDIEEKKKIMSNLKFMNVFPHYLYYTVHAIVYYHAFVKEHCERHLTSAHSQIANELSVADDHLH